MERHTASMGTVATRLQNNGHTIQDITWLLYGHDGNQAYYTILYQTKKPVNKMVVMDRLLEDGYTWRDAAEMVSC